MLPPSPTPSLTPSATPSPALLIKLDFDKTKKKTTSKKWYWIVFLSKFLFKYAK